MPFENDIISNHPDSPGHSQNHILGEEI